MNRRGSYRSLTRALACLLSLLVPRAGRSAEPPALESLAREYEREIRPLVKQFCLECHSTEVQESDLDLERFATIRELRGAARTWVKVAEKLDDGEMPPKDARQPSPDQRRLLRGWVAGYLNAQARASAGDPGPVVLRRLNNAEYSYTVSDLTGIDLKPTREFPADGAAGEGFTNTGNALVMSPALLTKYLDAGKEIASHAVLLPAGMRFSTGTTRRDWTDELLATIKAFYARFVDAEGRLPLNKYLAATFEEREALTQGTKTAATVAQQRGLNARYLAALWHVLNGTEPSPLLDHLRARWRSARATDAAALVAEIAQWQRALSRFQNVGHMKPWGVPVNPVTTRQELRLTLPEPTSANDVTVYLTAGDAGDGNTNDFFTWEQPRLVLAGRPSVALRDVRELADQMVARRERVFGTAARCLTAAAAAEAAGAPCDRAELARRHDVDPDALAAWFNYLGAGSNATQSLDRFTGRLTKVANYAFVNGWGSHETPLLVANSSGQHVRIPGNARPYSVAVHPGPKLYAAVGWRSPITGEVRVQGKVTRAHPECGNGVTWSLELRRGATRQRLASGKVKVVSSGFDQFGPIETIAVQPGDLISLLIGPRDGNHACDLTDLEFTLKSPGDGDGDWEWDLARDVSGDVLAGNPHADRWGHNEVWYFYSEPVSGHETAPAIPAGSLLARWQTTADQEQKRKLVDAIQTLLTAGPPKVKDHPDAMLYRQLASLGGPLYAGRNPNTRGSLSHLVRRCPPSSWGLDPAQFGRHPDGSAVDATSLCVQAPSVVVVRLPGDMVAGCELVTTAVLNRETGAEGSVQSWLSTVRPGPARGLRADGPVLVTEKSAARARIERAFDDFRHWFPAALCYTKIVPVDEAVTLTLFHREDQPLEQLLLDETQKAQLDRMWDELHFVSRDALTQVDAFAQLMEYATQDSDPRLFEPFRKPIHERAAAYRRALIDAEPRQVDALVTFAERAYRRPLAEAETKELRRLYRTLRAEGLPHDEAFRLTLARVFVAPAFLYRIEKAAPGQQSAPVSAWELASRLSYFLWSSQPDAELRAAASAGRLGDPDVLAAQTRRMLGDARVRRLATEFACQWLHIYEFDTLDEKSERHFPSFAGLRSDMYEEVIGFFTDLFQRDGSVLTILDSDHTYLNEALAKHYDIPGVTGPAWRRVEGIRKYGRGGVLGFSATLAKQSGASRTSPILRGNWVAEALLGDKLPRPPKDVPRLPDDETATAGLTVRQLVEKHTRDVRCAVCHVRIDPFGYALEGFDTIGRRRDKDMGDRPIDTHAKVRDGAEFDGLDGLRRYLLTARRDAFLRQFCRKLLGYALARGVQLSDEPLLEEIQQQLRNKDYRFSVAVETIVRSRQFREIRGKDALVADRR